MKPNFNPIRLFAELIAIVALAQAGVMLALPLLGLENVGAAGSRSMLLSAVLLALLSGPLVYWRCMAAARRAPSALARPATRSAGASVRSAVAMTAAAQLLGLAATAGAVAWQQRALDHEARTRFERGAERIENEIRRSFAQPLYGLNGERAMYAGGAALDAASIRNYVEARDLPTEFPGIRGFGFIQRVLRSELDSFTAQTRTLGAPDFAVRSSGTAPDLYVVKHIEPMANNRAAWGFDVGQEAVRREAVERAISTGQEALSGKITLVQDGKQGPGFLYLVPISRRGTNPITPQQRLSMLTGLVYVPIVAAELMQGVVKAADETLAFALFDQDPTQASALIFDSNHHLDTATGTLTAAHFNGGRFESSRKISVGGRMLALRVRTTPAFGASIDRSSLAFIAVSGVLASGLMALAVWLLAVGRVRAQNRAQRMTAELDLLARVVRHTSNAVVITDAALHISWVNDGFTRITGFTLAEAQGRTPVELLGTGKADPATLRTLLDAAAAGTACRLEVLNRAKDGREYWIDTEVQPTRDANGVLVGFMEVGTDITAQKTAHLQLLAAQRETAALLGTVNRHAIVSVADRAGNIIAINDAFCAISGYARDELLGRNHRIVNSGVQAPAFWLEMWHTISSGTPWRGDVCNRAKDGSLYWVDSMIAPFLGADGQVEKYVSIRIDISQRKRDEEVLRASQAFLDRVGRIAGVGGWQVDLATDAISWSDETCRIHELAPGHQPSLEEALNFYAPAARPVIRAAVQAGIDEARAWDLELPLNTASGRSIWVRAVGDVEFEAGRPVRLMGAIQDITERKLAERALRDALALVQAVGDSLLNHIAVLDRDGVIVSVNKAWQHFAAANGAGSGRAAAGTGVGTGYADICRAARGEHSEEANDVATGITDVLAGRRDSFSLEYPCHAPDRQRWFHMTVTPLRATSGGAVVMHADITERKHQEAQVRRSNEILTGVIENLPCGLSVFDAELRLVVHNTEMRRLLDLPESLFAGTEPRFEQLARFNAERGEYGAGDVDAIVAPIIERARAPTQHQFERTRPNGAAMEVRGAAMPGGGFVTTYTDISARKRAQAEATRAQAVLNGSIDALDDAYALFDPDDRLLLCNQRYRDLYPLSADMMVIGNSFEQIIRFGAERGQQPAAIGRVDDWVAERLAIHRQPHSQLQQRLADGRTLRIVERRMPDGHTVSFCIDITEFIKATEAAEAASRSKSQFLANMSHEIRTPMNAILGMLKLLQNTALNARQLDYASKTEGAARSLLGLLNDILDFSKVDAGKMTLDLRPFRLDRLLRDLSVILSANTGTKDIEVLYDIDPALPRGLLGDDMRLQQVLINLGGNAIKFTSVGQVVLRLRALELTAHDVLLEVAVRDSGIGIAPEHQGHIFSGFSQAEASTTRRFGGTGLGLAICQRLVGLMGGELRLDSVLGEGSTFHFQLRLPLAEVPADEPALLRPDMGALQALIVDDNASARELLANMVVSLGWQADVAASGAEAMALAKARTAAGGSYQVVFVDWQMPGLDGWETSQRLRQIPGLAESSLVVMVTAHGREMLAQRSAQEQSLLNGFLVKPVTASMLFDAVADARIELAHPALLNRPVAARQRRLEGMRLLVIEDNLNNQQVAQELLEDEGASVTLADNGELGVAAVAAARPAFDAVLMDLQMPVMDGYTAATTIRQELGLALLPIIAMTANAMASDREACLAAGMNEHVGKPFDLDKLVSLLLRCTGRTNLPNLPNLPNSPKAVGAAAAAGLPQELLAQAARSGIDLAGALERMAGNSGVYQRLLGSFAKDLAAMPGQLDALLQRGQRVDASRLMHTLKGLAATLGLKPLAEVANDVEGALLGSETPGQHAALAAALHAAAPAALQAIAQLAAALQQATEAPAIAAEAGHGKANDQASAQRLSDALRELMGLLRSADMRAVDVFEQLQQTHAAQTHTVLQTALQPLDDAMAALDFERALAQCQALTEELER